MKDGPCLSLRCERYAKVSVRVDGSLSSSLYAGMTIERDFVGSEKIEGAGSLFIDEGSSRVKSASRRRLSSLRRVNQAERRCHMSERAC